jgi:hypothetical protein
MIHDSEIKCKIEKYNIYDYSNSGPTMYFMITLEQHVEDYDYAPYSDLENYTNHMKDLMFEGKNRWIDYNRNIVILEVSATPTTKEAEIYYSLLATHN